MIARHNREHTRAGGPRFEASNPLTVVVELVGQPQDVAGGREPHQRLRAVRIRADFAHHAFDDPHHDVGRRALAEDQFSRRVGQFSMMPGQLARGLVRNSPREKSGLEHIRAVEQRDLIHLRLRKGGLRCFRFHQVPFRFDRGKIRRPGVPHTSLAGAMSPDIAQLRNSAGGPPLGQHQQRMCPNERDRATRSLKRCKRPLYGRNLAHVHAGRDSLTMIRRRLYGDRGESRVKIPTRTRALFPNGRGCGASFFSDSSRTEFIPSTQDVRGGVSKIHFRMKLTAERSSSLTHRG